MNSTSKQFKKKEEENNHFPIFLLKNSRWMTASL